MSAPTTDQLGRGGSVSSGPILLRLDYRKLATRLLAACIALELVLVVLDYHLSFGASFDVGAVKRLFNIAREDGLASWFQATQTLMAALTLWLVYVLVSLTPSSRWIARGWLVIAAFFTYMAVDDGAQIHERVASTVDALSAGEASRFPSYTWQLLFMPVFAALGLFMFVFLLRQLRSGIARALLVLAMASMAFAVGLDFIEGLSKGDPLNLYAHVARSSDELRAWSFGRFDTSAYETLRHFSRALEELLEMVAISTLWCLFVAHLADVAPDFRVRSV